MDKEAHKFESRLPPNAISLPKFNIFQKKEYGRELTEEDKEAIRKNEAKEAVEIQKPQKEYGIGVGPMIGRNLLSMLVSGLVNVFVNPSIK